jgi:mRNA interferase YafQ
MLRITFTSKMKQDVKRVRKRGKDLRKLEEVLGILASQKPLPDYHRDHQLAGDLKDFRECHIEPDWLLMYQIRQAELVLSATRTGSHSDLFKR